MNKINTREKLVEYVRSRLGEPIIRVELTDTQIGYIIDETITKFSEFAYDGQMSKPMLIPLFPNVKEYKLDNRISSVIDLKILRGGINYGLPQGYVYDMTKMTPLTLNLADYETTLAKISKFEHLFDVRPNYSFNGLSKILTFHEDVSAYSNALIDASLDYEPEAFDLIYNQPWVKDMTVAQCKYQWGNNVGKYSGALINGNTINYSDIKSDGMTDIERLNEELLKRWSPPLGVVIG
jgi:hypothetical protein